MLGIGHYVSIVNMKTIAITIDEDTLKAIDTLVRGDAGARRKGARGPSRSAIVRMALAEFLARRRRAQRDEHDRQVIAENRERLLADAKGLVAEQARP